jgi:sugar lactone lactonase YvrE
MGKDGRLYLTDTEHNAVLRRTTPGDYETVAWDPAMAWPDSLAFAPDGRLWITASQFRQLARFHGGKDQRKKPWLLFSVDVAPALVSLR